MSIYAHVPTKDQLPGQCGYFLELVRVAPDVLGEVRETGVTTLRYMVAGPLFMRFEKLLSNKQGRWDASYMADEAQAHQLLKESVTMDSDLSALRTGSTISRVTELTVGLNETDLVQIKDRARRGIDARWRAVHWAANHLGSPAIKGTTLVEMEGGVD